VIVWDRGRSARKRAEGTHSFDYQFALRAHLRAGRPRYQKFTCLVSAHGPNL